MNTQDGAKEFISDCAINRHQNFAFWCLLDQLMEA
jgi:hypothetical protein